MLSSLPLLFFAICCFWLPESARYLMASGKEEEAYAVLQSVAKQNGKTLPTGKLVQNVSHNVSIYCIMFLYCFCCYFSLRIEEI